MNGRAAKCPPFFRGPNQIFFALLRGQLVCRTGIPAANAGWQSIPLAGQRQTIYFARTCRCDLVCDARRRARTDHRNKLRTRFQHEFLNGERVNCLDFGRRGPRSGLARRNVFCSGAAIILKTKRRRMARRWSTRRSSPAPQAMAAGSWRTARCGSAWIGIGWPRRIGGRTWARATPHFWALTRTGTAESGFVNYGMGLFHARPGRQHAAHFLRGRSAGRPGGLLVPRSRGNRVGGSGSRRFGAVAQKTIPRDWRRRGIIHPRDLHRLRRRQFKHLDWNFWRRLESLAGRQC